jgi:hypothetical protein
MKRASNRFKFLPDSGVGPSQTEPQDLLRITAIRTILTTLTTQGRLIPIRYSLFVIRLSPSRVSGTMPL